MYPEGLLPLARSYPNYAVTGPLFPFPAIVFQDHPNSPVSHLWGIPTSFFHRPFLSSNGASGNPGPVHLPTQPYYLM